MTRSFTLLAVAALVLVLAFSSSPGAFAAIISASLNPQCGPPGTNGTLLIRYTGSHPTVQADPDLGPLGGDEGEGVVGIYFTVPDGVHQITFTIFQDGVPLQTVIFCPSTSAPVGGFMQPVNKLAVFAPYLALFGVVAAVAIMVWKRPEH